MTYRITYQRLKTNGPLKGMWVDESFRTPNPSRYIEGLMTDENIRRVKLSNEQG